MPEERGGQGADERWPALNTPGWEETAETLLLWMQMVGKVRLALAPMMNHWWQVPLYVSVRGLTTSPIHYDGGLFELEFDFPLRRLWGRTSWGAVDCVALRSVPVEAFYAELKGMLDALGIQVHIWPVPVETPAAIPFDRDRQHAAYDPEWGDRLFQALTNADGLLKVFRSGFVGKASPVHFFWGAMDLAVSRFSGRRAPLHPGGAPHVGAWVMQEAYSHEVSSAGFWPGDRRFPHAAFYSYVYPEPPGFREAAVLPAGAYYDASLAEFILPYERVRSSATPSEDVLQFLDSTYSAAADLGGWDRRALEREAFEDRGIMPDMQPTPT